MITIANPGQHLLRHDSPHPMLPTQQYSSPSATSGIRILEPHAEASQKKLLDVPGPFSPTFTADQSRGWPMQSMAVDELSEDPHRDEEVNTLDVVGAVSDFVGTLFTSAFLRPMKHLGLHLLTLRSILEP